MAAERVTTATSAAERAARTSYGRLVALLAARSGDLALAQDAVAAAFEQALTTWEERGVPTNPEGWLLAVARNRQRDAWRAAARQRPTDPDDLPEDATVPLDDLDPDALPDRRLELLFVCAHPAIDPGVRAPLMLQTVLGFDAAQIGRAFAASPATMAQRLVRAKRRIRGARIPFAVPTREVLRDRLPAVLEAVYGCFVLETCLERVADLPRAAGFQPYWAVRAHLLARAGRVAEATGAYARAETLTDDVGVRAYLQHRRTRIQVAGSTV